MIAVCMVGAKEERNYLELCSRDTVAELSDEKLEVTGCADVAAMCRELKMFSLLDIAFLDVTQKGMIPLARMIRKNFEQSEILLVADVSISPMTYLHPSIRAASLLLKPFKGDTARRVLRDFFEDFLKNRMDNGRENTFFINGREGMICLPESQILYFEAREKKVYVRVKFQEYSMRSTLEKLALRLPKNFLRCHRGFIVNTDWIYKVKLSENQIMLRGDICVPVSRSYKTAVKEYVCDRKDEK